MRLPDCWKMEEYRMQMVEERKVTEGKRGSGEEYFSGDLHWSGCGGVE